MASKSETPGTPSGLASLNANLLKSGEYSDLTITCHGKSFKIHRNIVCPQSKVLAAAANGRFKEGQTGVIDLEGDEPEVVEKMLDYLYTHDYSDTQSSSNNNGNAQPSDVLLLSTKLYVAGEIYDIPTLKDLAAKKYENMASKDWNLATFLSSLDYMYQHTREEDRILKKAAMNATADHIDELLLSEIFWVLCKKYGEIGFDALKVAHHGPSSKPVNDLNMIFNGCGSPCVETFPWGDGKKKRANRCTRVRKTAGFLSSRGGTTISIGHLCIVVLGSIAVVKVESIRFLKPALYQQFISIK